MKTLERINDLSLRLFVAASCAGISLPSWAECDSATDPNCPPDNSSDGGTLTDLSSRLIVSIGEVAGVVTVIAALMGVVVTCVSLYTFYRSTKDERERPAGAVVGLLVGGALISIPTFMWIIYNTLVKAPTTTG